MKKLLLLLSVTMFLPLTAGDTASKAKEMLKQVVPGTICFKAGNGWLYSKNELAHLAKGEIAGGKAASVSDCRNRRNADPVPALKLFHNDLAALGIKLIILPVPPKLSAAPYGSLKSGEAMQYLRPFYQELRDAGLNVLDISTGFNGDGSRFFCRTDAHWSPTGIALAVGMLEKEIQLRGKNVFTVEESRRKISGGRTHHLFFSAWSAS